MDVFDLQASVKIDTTDANQKLDALIAKAKELNNLLDSPHNVNINGGGGGNGGTPYVSNPSSAPSGPTGLNGYVPLLPVPMTPSSAPTVNGLNAGQSTFNLGAGNQALRLGSGDGSFGSNLPSVSTPQDTTITANNGARVDLGSDFFAGMITTGTTMAPTAMMIDYAASHIYSLSEETESSLRAQGDAYKEARRNGYKGSVTDWVNGDMYSWTPPPTYTDVPRQGTTSELGRDSKGGLQRRRNVKTGGNAVTDYVPGTFDAWDYMTDIYESGRAGSVTLDDYFGMLEKHGQRNGIENAMTYNGYKYFYDAFESGKSGTLTIQDAMDNVSGKIFNDKQYEKWKNGIEVSVIPEVDATAAADIAAQVGEVTIPARVAVTEVIGTGGVGAGGDASSVAGAVNKLSNKLDHMTIQVGKKTFGRTVVDNGGRSLQDFLGASQQSVASGYGWR